MKSFQKIWLFISFVIICVTAVKLLSAYVSFKYEVQEVVSVAPSELIDYKKESISYLIFILWASLLYLSINMFILFKGVKRKD